MNVRGKLLCGSAPSPSGGVDVVVFGDGRQRTHVYNSLTQEWRNGPAFPNLVQFTETVVYKDTFIVPAGDGGTLIYE